MTDQSDHDHATLVGADGLAYRLRVHQATGMVAAQAGCDVAAALARIVGYATEHGATVDDIADSVVARRLRFG